MQSVLQGRAKWDCLGDFVRVSLHLLPGLDPADATAKVDGVRSETACIVLCLLFSGQEECTYIHGTIMFSGQEECTYIQGKKRERERERDCNAVHHIAEQQLNESVMPSKHCVKRSLGCT